ncbi:TPA: hypothetical protein CPT88_07100 [Candidatus Gastranaerophilales bacterium HUM_8]|mgnify:FL=1|nr:MAG TPA: hypothetical protein CPT88_07100 [Candidatus Gastranaerophilales bacterium HUM_8]DAA99740.1 MAG TPA: hypothetical protein CPT89_09090 [Candidatus Gastranaerophilales bacterium HUM_11]
MKINAVGVDYSVLRAKNRNVKEAEAPKDIAGVPKGMSMISFKSGNPRHIAHMVAEEPLFGFNGGGVGTVVNDYNYLDNKDVDKIVKFIPLYNQQVDYKKDIDPKTGKVRHPIGQGVKVRYIPDNLPANHPFKGKEGTPFVTAQSIDNATDLVKFLEEKKGNVFLLEEVKSSKMNWGMEENVPIKMFRAQKDENLIKAMDAKKISKETQNKLEFVFTYVDSTASMAKQYADDSYASASGDALAKKFSSGWQGQPYPKEARATVELMPALKEKYNIDPKYILCSDGQTMFTMHYAAQKNAAGDAYWMDKFLGGVGHNMNAGYDQPMGARQAIVNLGATKEDLTKLLNSKEYIEAVKLGREEDFLRETVLKNFVRPKSGMNAFNVAIHYAKTGYSPMLTTVSEGYHDSLITNDLVSAMYNDLVELDKLGRFKGLTNPLMDPNVSPFSEGILQPGYKSDVKLKLKDGSVVTVNKFQVFDKNKADLKTVRDVKRQNKINLLERFSQKFVDSVLLDETGKEISKPNQGRMHILAGKSDRNLKIYGNIADEYLAKLKKGEDVKLIVSWGRGDFQKSMDTVIDTFEKYAEKDPNAILIFGGDMKYEPETVEKFELAASKPKLKGRMIMTDGWTPGKDWAMAGDAALLPSRFAPCELTDLEAKKALCTPITPNVQGMAQKNFDPDIAADAKLMDAYKGKHEYFMSEETALKAANEDAKTAFNKIKDKLVSDITKKYKGQINEDIPAELLKETLEADEEYKKALRKLRDSVISDEMAECLERALIRDRNSKNAETILANQIKADTTWFGNAWLSATGKSSGQLYFDYHFNNKGKNISKNDLIKLDFSGLRHGITGGSGGNSIHFNGKTKKIAAVALGLAALTGLGITGYKCGWLSPKFAEEKKHGHLSCVG